MSIVWLIVATVLAAGLYRLGGAAKTGRWYDFMCDTKVRDCGVATVGLLVIQFLCPHSDRLWAHIAAMVLTGGLMFAASTSYFKKKGEPARWYNWLLVGLAASCALFPYAYSVGNYTGFAYRTILLTLGTMVWSEHIENVVWEECGRGALVIATMVFFL